MIIKIAGIVYIMLSTYNTIISLINEKDYVIETWQETNYELSSKF